MTSFEWRGRPHLPKMATALVREALLPILRWPSVPVLRRVNQGLTIVDRFILEAALALDPMLPQDVEEVTQIPRDAVLRIAGRLAGLGLLEPAGEGFHPAGDATLEALQERTAPRYITTHLTFLYLPEGDDLIAFASGKGRTSAPLLYRAEPIADVELPSWVGGKPLADFVGKRIREGRVAGLPTDEDIVDASDGDGQVIIPPVSPVYRCTGHVAREEGEARLALDIISPTGKKEACSIPGAVGQARRWEAIATLAPGAATPWNGAIVTTRESPVRWRFALNREAADAAVRDGVAISRPAGLEVTDPRGVVKVAVEVVFEPSGPGAPPAFAVDHAVRELADTLHTALAPDAAEIATAAARRRYEIEGSVVTSADVEQRLWDERHYRHAYALREFEDFAYD